MNAYKVELLVLDFDGLGEKGVVDALENVRYPNRCISPSVMNIDCRDIGEWDDSHPLNHHGKAPAEYERLFGG